MTGTPGREKPVALKSGESCKRIENISSVASKLKAPTEDKSLSLGRRS